MRFLTILLLAAPLLAQPPLENDQVRVVYATDKPHEKGAPHEHKFNRVMVYLDAGRQEIAPQNGKPTVLNYKAGDVRWSPANGIHTSQVLTDKAVRIVEVEVKKPASGKPWTKPALDTTTVDPKDYKVEFENDQVRVLRVKFPPHHKVPLHEHVLNRVVVCLTDQDGKIIAADGTVTTSQHKAGEASWGGPGKHAEENLMARPFEAIVVELKN